MCGWIKWKATDILCYYSNTAFSLTLLRSPNVADFITIAVIHTIIPATTEQAWSLNALLKDMKQVIQTVAHDQAGVQYGLQWQLTSQDARSL